MVHSPWSLSAAAFSGLALMVVPPCAAQVTVGYNALTSVVGAATVDQAYRQRTTDRYEITGSNVEPEGGGLMFDRNTIWHVKDQTQPWSLNIADDNPKVDVSKEPTSTKLVPAARRESSSATLSEPYYSTLERRTLSPFARVIMPAILPISTTVFPEQTSP
ncbi:MAG: hypothetical protein ACKOCM_00845 [Cyanobacteriota bacterium]